jgi:hypothetical protein
MPIDDYFPKDEGHHCDGSGIGPADTWIPRPGHQWIHQDVARACRSFGEKTKGFAGDPTTLKLGNSFFEENSEDAFPGLFSKKPKKKHFNALAYMSLLSTDESTEPEITPLLRYTPPESSIPKKTIDYAKICSALFPKDESKDTIPSFYRYKPLVPETPSETPLVFPDLLHSRKPKNPYEFTSPIFPLTESIAHTENQKHWLGMDKPAEEKPWSLTSSFKPPVLEPRDITQEPEYVAYQSGLKIYEGLLEQQRQEKINFERSNPGIADFQNSIYKRNMLDRSSIPTLGSMPLPRGMTPFRL